METSRLPYAIRPGSYPAQSSALRCLLTSQQSPLNRRAFTPVTAGSRRGYALPEDATCKLQALRATQSPEHPELSPQVEGGPHVGWGYGYFLQQKLNGQSGGGGVAKGLACTSGSYVNVRIISKTRIVCPQPTRSLLEVYYSEPERTS